MYDRLGLASSMFLCLELGSVLESYMTKKSTGHNVHVQSIRIDVITVFYPTWHEKDTNQKIRITSIKIAKNCWNKFVFVFVFVGITTLPVTVLTREDYGRII